ncbi:unnamed protein product, partial [Ectocarpus sp. 12 AP-2014]
MRNLSTTLGVVVVGIKDCPAPRNERKIATAVCLLAMYGLLHLRRSVEMIFRILDVRRKIRISRNTHVSLAHHPIFLFVVCPSFRYVRPQFLCNTLHARSWRPRRHASAILTGYGNPDIMRFISP